MNTTEVKAYGAEASDASLKEMKIKRRSVTPKDIEIKILYCGVCHSDLHTVRNDWGGSVYPVIPGHEIVGKITAVGSDVKKFKVGDLAAVGCMVDSCRHCNSCENDLEQYCEQGHVGTYNGPDKYLGGHTYGGYSEKIIVDEHFGLKIPANLNLKAVAPLLCAGVTTWSPLMHWKVTKSTKVAVVGLGGLGHMAIKLAKGLGADVTLFSRTPNKIEDAKRLGADTVIISTDENQMKSVTNKFDLIIDTVPNVHDLNPYIPTLNINGTLVLVGFIGNLKDMISTVPLIMGRRTIAGSVIGGIAETQEMLDFCGKHNITADVEMIDMQNINAAYDRMVRSDVKYRFVIDMDSLTKR